MGTMGKMLAVQGRLSMEVHALLAYGSASETMKLMWRHELLDFMFPLLAGYLSEKKFPRYAPFLAGRVLACVQGCNLSCR